MHDLHQSTNITWYYLYKDKNATGIVVIVQIGTVKIWYWFGCKIVSNGKELADTNSTDLDIHLNSDTNSTDVDIHLNSYVSPFTLGQVSLMANQAQWDHVQVLWAVYAGAKSCP